MRTKIIFIIFLAITSRTFGLNCTYNLYTFKNPEKHWSCIVKQLIPRFDIDENVTFSGSTNGMVGFTVVNNLMPYIPRNFGDVFSGLKAMQIKNSSLEEIIPENFNKLKDLEYLDLSMNHIQYLDGGLFEHNSKLVTINLKENKINVIDPDFAMSLKNSEINLEGNTCISGKYQQKSWNHANPTINGTCWSTMKKLEMNVIKNSLIIQRMRRSIDSLNTKNSFTRDSKTIEKENQLITQSISALIKNDSDSKFTKLTSDLNQTNTIEKRMEKKLNEVKSKILDEMQKIIKNTTQDSKGKNENLKNQLSILESNINKTLNDSLTKVNNLLNKMNKNISNQTNINSELLEFVENKIQNSLWNWNMMINIINTALLTLLITMVIISHLCKSNKKSSQDPQYDKIKKVPSRANSTIKSQRDLSVHPLSFDTLRRDNSQNIADHDYFGITQHNAYNDADHKSHNSNLDHSDTVYECTHWDESKKPYLDSEINENVAVEDNYEGLYSEIPSQINEVVTEDKKDDSQIYAVITKN